MLPFRRHRATATPAQCITVATIRSCYRENDAPPLSSSVGLGKGISSNSLGDRFVHFCVWLDSHTIHRETARDIWTIPSNLEQARDDDTPPIQVVTLLGNLCLPNKLLSLSTIDVCHICVCVCSVFFGLVRVYVRLERKDRSYFTRI